MSVINGAMFCIFSSVEHQHINAGTLKLLYRTNQDDGVVVGIWPNRIKLSSFCGKYLKPNGKQHIITFTSLGKGTKSLHEEASRVSGKCSLNLKALQLQ